MRWRARARRAPRSPRQASRNRSWMKPAIRKAGPMATRPRSVVRATASCTPHRTQAAESGRGPVVAFRVLERIGQILVTMVGKVGGAIDRIGKPQRQGPGADRLIDAAVAGRMAVNGLVLQVQLPRDDPGAQRGEGPPRKVPVEIRPREPRPVNGESQPGRRPFDAAFKRRKFDNLHDLAPRLTPRQSPDPNRMIAPNPAPANIILL